MPMSYLQGKARKPSKGMEGIIGVIAPRPGGEHRTHLLGEGRTPFCSSAPETVEAARRRCQQTLGIQPEEWETLEGEPFWLPILYSAWKDTITKLSPDQ